MHRLLALSLFAAAGACTAPGFAPATLKDGPSLALVVDDIEPGRAVARVVATDLGALFGLSLHVVVGDGLTPREAEAVAVLGDDAIRVARIDGADVALGGTRRAPQDGDVDVADGEVGSFVVTAVEAGAYAIDITHPVGRTADGAFVPLAAAGGTLTLEAP